MRRARTAMAVVAVVAGSATGCGDGGPEVLTVESAWARPTPAGAANGVVYFTIASPDDDVLTAVRVPADVAGAATMHETDTDGGGGHEHHGGDAGGSGESEAAMRELSGIEVPGGEELYFAPGGLHVMLTGLPDPLVEGEVFELTLELERAGELTTDVVVTNAPP